MTSTRLGRQDCGSSTPTRALPHCPGATLRLTTGGSGGRGGRALPRSRRGDGLGGVVSPLAELGLPPNEQMPGTAGPGRSTSRSPSSRTRTAWNASVWMRRAPAGTPGRHISAWARHCSRKAVGARDAQRRTTQASRVVPLPAHARIRQGSAASASAAPRRDPAATSARNDHMTWIPSCPSTFRGRVRARHGAGDDPMARRARRRR
jgi:hypothetical protein